MDNGTCTHNWCETGHATDPELNAHEAKRVEVDGIAQPAAPVSKVSLIVSYVDGDRAPLLYVGGGDVELTPDGLDELIAVLQEQRLIMRSVQATAANVGIAA